MIEIKEYDPGIGNEHNAMRYPQSGLYYIPRTQGFALVVGACVAVLYGARETIQDAPAPATVDVARLLAVALHRDAAMEVVK